ncbi:hypothetical protein ACNKHM_21720 [Shigella sonnei]
MRKTRNHKTEGGFSPARSVVGVGRWLVSSQGGALADQRYRRRRWGWGATWREFQRSGVRCDSLARQPDHDSAYGKGKLDAIPFA